MYDVIIIGAGVIGASAARELSRYKLKIAVLEAKADVAMGSTGANSAIVHAGYDCKPGTLMAELNVRGNRLYDQIKQELDIPFERMGSLVLAQDEEEEKELKELFQQGVENGVPDMEILSRNQVLEMEPEINPQVQAALWAPSAGITCPYELTVALMENAIENGVEIFLEHPVQAAAVQSDGSFMVETSHRTFHTRFLINCAGLYSDDIARMVGDDGFNILPRKGEYCLYDRKYGGMAKHVLFQVPGKMGKGVLVTPTVDGNLLVGPNAVDVKDKGDTRTTAEGLDFVYQKALESVPHLPQNGVIRSFSGLRAVSDQGDFIIKPSSKVKGVIHAAGICSPGLSAAPAIGERIAELLIKQFGNAAKNETFKPYRKGIPRFREMNWEERQRLMEENPQYGRIVCRCETVTEGQVVEALKRSLPALTIDAVKRRTRAGMGRCQGGFCTPRVMEIMERELDITLLEITKSGNRSNIVVSKIKEELKGDSE